jgi:cytochrome c553
MTGRESISVAGASKMSRLTVCIFALFTLASCGERESAKSKSAGEPTVDVSAGQTIAQRSCVSCHRADGAGAAPGIPQLGRQNAAYLVQSMQQYAAGTRRHAVLKDMTPQLSDADIRNVAAYYASLPIPTVAPVTPQGPGPYERGKASAAACAGCHGVDGNSTIPGTPSLAGQQPIFLLAAMAEYHRGDRSPPDLQAMLRRADAVEVESLALYYASQAPKARFAPAVGNPAAGESLALRCTGCHGWRGVSDDAATPMLAGQDPAYLVKALAGYGKSRHHASMERQLGPLGEKEIRDIAAYFATQTGRASQPAQDLVAQLSDKCDRCHGAAGGEPPAPVPRIRGQDKNYLVMALRSYRDDRRASSTMHKMSLPFSEAVIEGLAAHYARQPPQ